MCAGVALLLSWISSNSSVPNATLQFANVLSLNARYINRIKAQCFPSTPFDKTTQEMGKILDTIRQFNLIDFKFNWICEAF